MAELAMRRGPRPGRLHPPALRVMHWLNAFATIVMIGSGWRIYNDEVLFGWLVFPVAFTLGGEPGLSTQLHSDGGASNALLWHFAAMWLLVVNGLLYLAYGLLTGRFRRMLLPLRPREVLAEFGQALRFRLRHGDATRYNAVQKLLYLGVIAVAMVQVLSGLAIWKPVQLQGLTALFGGFQGARLAHFLGMSAIVGFLVVHVALSLLVPRTLLAMLSGGPRLEERAGLLPAHAPAALPEPGE